MFYGWEKADVPPIREEFRDITDPRELYRRLSGIWCAQTCAPRLRQEWSPDNPTLGQCSVTAFLAQDIFGGEVRGVRRPGGNFHCFNVVGSCVFDLTSEQFKGEALEYSRYEVQYRQQHFVKEEKRLRYEALKTALMRTL